MCRGVGPGAVARAAGVPERDVRDLMRGGVAPDRSVRLLAQARAAVEGLGARRVR